jgi:hypothetical protein
MMQTTTPTPENPDAASTSMKRRCFEVVVNFAKADGVGECMLALNRRGLVYTNSAEPIEEWEHVISGTVSGAVELAAGEDDKDAIDKARSWNGIPFTRTTQSLALPGRKSGYGI